MKCFRFNCNFQVNSFFFDEHAQSNLIKKSIRNIKYECTYKTHLINHLHYFFLFTKMFHFQALLSNQNKLKIISLEIIKKFF